MFRKIITIDEERCDGCGLCAQACNEGAIAIINGKAKLVREDYCDGLGNCLPVCPQNAISVTEKDTLPFSEPKSEKSARKHKNSHLLKKKAKPVPTAEHHRHNHHEDGETLACGCSKNTIRSLKPAETACTCQESNKENCDGALSQWPVQIKLLPVTAPFYENSKLLIAADCTAYAYRNFHRDFIAGRITLVGCPKLDDTDYSEKLAEILKANTVAEILLTRMEVPCCGGMEQTVKKAIALSGKKLPLTVYTISAEGRILKIETI